MNITIIHRKITIRFASFHPWQEDVTLCGVSLYGCYAVKELPLACQHLGPKWCLESGFVLHIYIFYEYIYNYICIYIHMYYMENMWNIYGKIYGTYMENIWLMMMSWWKVDELWPPRWFMVLIDFPTVSSVMWMATCWRNVPCHIMPGKLPSGYVNS